MTHSSPRKPAALTPDERPSPLDPRTLGRPVHLLPRFAEQMGEALGELFRGLNRRYRAQYEIGEISIKPVGPLAGAARWMVGDSSHGRLACQADRSLVLSLMAHRYGDKASAAGTEAALPPETATEERMLNWLSQQLLQRALPLIEAELPCPSLQASSQAQLSAGAWFVQITVREAQQGLQAQLLLALDPLYISKLLKRLGEALPPRQDLAPRPDGPLAKRLSLTVAARLLEQPMLLGEVLDLRPGDLIPVRLKSTDVLVDGSRLFTASVAEHQGKLCLTSFADAE